MVSVLMAPLHRQKPEKEIPIRPQDKSACAEVVELEGWVYPSPLEPVRFHQKLYMLDMEPRDLVFTLLDVEFVFVGLFYAILLL